jgi:hypothetical protein
MKIEVTDDTIRLLNNVGWYMTSLANRLVTLKRSKQRKAISEGIKLDLADVNRDLAELGLEGFELDYKNYLKQK